MSYGTRQRIRKRLRFLMWGELVNLPVQSFVWFVFFGFPVTAANAFGFGLFLLLLVEGAGYWRAKMRQLDRGARHLPGVEIFRHIRTVNVVLLTAGLALTLWMTITDPGSGSIPGLIFALVGVGEHINYFHTQLMYDNRSDLRTLATRGIQRASLARDLARHKAWRQRFAAATPGRTDSGHG